MPEPSPRGALRVGLAGAGPWAQFVHAPMLAQHPATTLVGVWARRPAAAEAVARPHGAVAFERFDRLLASCDAVAFALPPDVQAELAMVAAKAGKAVLLEKPIGLDLDTAVRLADAIGEAGVGSQIVLTWRYAAVVRAFLDAVAAIEPIAGRGWFISGGALGGPFATPWRLQHGALLDVGPHVLDLLDAALGPIVGVRAHGDPRRWTGMLLEHESGVVSEASLSARANVEPYRAGAEVYTEPGVVDLDAAAALQPGTMMTIVDEFVRTARGEPHPLDVHRGLHLQRLLDAAARSL